MDAGLGSVCSFTYSLHLLSTDVNLCSYIYEQDRFLS